MPSEKLFAKREPAARQPPKTPTSRTIQRTTTSRRRSEQKLASPSNASQGTPGNPKRERVRRSVRRMAISPAERDGTSHDTEALYREHGAAVAALCRSLLRDRGEAEDATQQVFLSAHRALLNGAAPREPRAWLLAVARNECYARFRERALDTDADRRRAGDGDRRRLGARPARGRAGHRLGRGRTDAADPARGLPSARDSRPELRPGRGRALAQRPSVRSLLLRARLRLRQRLGDVAAGVGGVPWVQALLRLVARRRRCVSGARRDEGGRGRDRRARAGGRWRPGRAPRCADRAPRDRATTEPRFASITSLRLRSPRSRTGRDSTAAAPKTAVPRSSTRAAATAVRAIRVSAVAIGAAAPRARVRAEAATTAPTTRRRAGSSSPSEQRRDGSGDNSSSGSGDDGSDGGGGTVTTATSSGSDSGSSDSSGSNGSGGGDGSDGGGSHDGDRPPSATFSRRTPLPR